MFNPKYSWKKKYFAIVMFFDYNYKIVKRNEDLSQKKINNHITKQNVP